MTVKKLIEFKPGDVVQLKSGGPPMTVCEKINDRFLNCSFFTQNGEFKNGICFEAIALKKNMKRLKTEK